jgi:hypothetical protein
MQRYKDYGQVQPGQKARSYLKNTKTKRAEDVA